MNLGSTEITLIHASMQFSDTPMQHKHDADAVFQLAWEQGAWFVDGTEAGSAEGNHDLRDALRLAAGKHGFHIYNNKYGDWVAGNNKYLEGYIQNYGGPYIPASTGLTAGQGGYGPRGITSLGGFDKARKLGRITMGVCHYLTRKSITAGEISNIPLVNGIADFGKKFGGGSKIVFLGADTNMRDDELDVFFGRPFTTAADELDFHPKTLGTDSRHGSAVDIIASYDYDSRVTCESWRVLDDSRLKLYTDHFVTEAVYSVRNLK